MQIFEISQTFRVRFSVIIFMKSNLNIIFNNYVKRIKYDKIT